MKMSDVFDVPVRVNDFDAVIDNECFLLAELDNEEMAKAAAHAINSHDALVEENKQLSQWKKEQMEVSAAMSDAMIGMSRKLSCPLGSSISESVPVAVDGLLEENERLKERIRSLEEHIDDISCCA